jgi:hypothetical protein
MPSGRNRLPVFLPGPIHALTVKEVKTFFRDQTQWSQLFLIAALVNIYIYNFKVLPLEKSPIQTVYLQNLLSFLNMGLASFVLIAIGRALPFRRSAPRGSVLAGQVGAGAAKNVFMDKIRHLFYSLAFSIRTYYNCYK